MYIYQKQNIAYLVEITLCFYHLQQDIKREENLEYLMIASSAQKRKSYNTEIYGLNMTVKHDSKTSAEKYLSSQIGHKLLVEISTPLPKSMH